MRRSCTESLVAAAHVVDAALVVIAIPALQGPATAVGGGAAVEAQRLAGRWRAARNTDNAVARLARGTGAAVDNAAAAVARLAAVRADLGAGTRRAWGAALVVDVADLPAGAGAAVERAAAAVGEGAAVITVRGACVGLASPRREHDVPAPAELVGGSKHVPSGDGRVEESEVSHAGVGIADRETRRGHIFRDRHAERDGHAGETAGDLRRAASLGGGLEACRRAGRAARAHDDRRVVADRVGRAASTLVAEQKVDGGLVDAAGDEALLIERARAGGADVGPGEARVKDALVAARGGEAPATDGAMAVRRVVLDVRRKTLRGHRERGRLRAAVGGGRDDGREGEPAVAAIAGVRPHGEGGTGLTSRDGGGWLDRCQRRVRAGERHQRPADRGKAAEHHGARGRAAAAPGDFRWIEHD